MFEYTFLSDGKTPHAGMTNDFVELCCQIAKYYGPKTLGEVLTELFSEHQDKLDYLRVIDWNFELSLDGKAVTINSKVN